MFPVKLFKHQSECVDFLVSKNGCGAVFHEMGLGKTITAIETYKRLKMETDLRMLVVCPVSLLDAAWRKEISLFPEFRCCNLRNEKIDDGANILLINFENLIQEKSLKKIRTLLAKGEWMCVVDESSRLKNHVSKTAKALLSLRAIFKYRIVMSGTPAPNSELEYWAQMEFASPGIFNRSFYAFRNTYFHLQNKYTGKIQNACFKSREAAAETFRNGWNYEISNANREKLLARIAPLCHRATKIECLDLPEMTDETRMVELPKKQMEIYERMKRHLVAEIQGHEIPAQTALTKLIKLREIACGFILPGIPEETPIEIGGAKFEELFSVLEELGENQAIIWCSFRWEVEKLARLFSERQISFGTLYSQTPNKDESIQKFIGGSAKYLIAHPRSAAHGLTFVNCSVEIFLSMDWSWEAYEQAKARIHRAGQTKKCLYVHLVAKNTIEEDILQLIQKKGEAQDLLYKLVEKS